MMIALISLLTFAATGNAMSYEQARNEALFLTDKMAYELNLTEDQYEAVYEINLDYLMGVTSYDDVYALGWERRNSDLAFVLFDWQLTAYRTASYFYRPLYWHGGYWHFGIYARYPRRDYFYFGRPVFYASYRGGHSWRMNGNRSWYQPRSHVYAPKHHRNHFGMKDGWDRGDFRNNHHSMRNSSTRTTVNRDWRQNNSHHRYIDRRNDNDRNWNSNRDNNRNNDRGWNSNRDNNRNNDRGWSSNRDNNRNHDRGWSSNRDNNRNNDRGWNSNRDNNRNGQSLGGYRSRENNRKSTLGGNNNSRSTTSSNHSFGSGNRSFGSGATRSVGNSSSNNGGGRSTGGGHSYGGRR